MGAADGPPRSLRVGRPCPCFIIMTQCRRVICISAAKCGKFKLEIMWEESNWCKIICEGKNLRYITLSFSFRSGGTPSNQDFGQIRAFSDALSLTVAIQIFRKISYPQPSFLGLTLNLQSRLHTLLSSNKGPVTDLHTALLLKDRRDGHCKC